MRLFHVCRVAIAAAAPLLLSAGHAQAQGAGAPAAAVRQSLDPKNFDGKTAACTDFFQHAVGGWRAANEIPASEGRWGRFQQLDEDNQLRLRTMLERYAKDAPTDDADYRKIGAYYGSCMNEAGIEAAGLKALQPVWQRIDKAADRKALQTEIATLQRDGNSVLFSVAALPDAKNPDIVIARVGQGGFSLPHKGYYGSDEPKMKELRDALVQHIDRMFQLAGDKTSEPGKTVLALETALVAGARMPAELRDPNKNYNKMPVAELQALTPGFDWAQYQKAYGINVTEINVGQPDALKAMAGVLAEQPLPALKTYLKWRTLSAEANALPKKFVDEDFAFNQKISGAKEQKPRWKRCIAATTAAMPDAVGKAFVKEVIDPKTKDRAGKMVDNLREALKETIQELTWMAPETKAKAVEKLAAITQHLTYPNTWKDYGKLQVGNVAYVENQRAARAFEAGRLRGKIGKPPERGEWSMSAATVNAYYSPLLNQIVFPAAILLPPFFDANADDAVNYGGIGVVIGHELTHGFDDNGRQYDAKGRLSDWWKPEDAAAYTKQAQCIIDEYNEFPATDDQKHNGKLVTGEAIADLGGATIAHRAFLKTEQAKKGEKIDGLTPEQRFFLSFGQIWASNIRDEFARRYVQVDPHPLGKYRVIGTVSNMPAFAKAFDCKPGDPMVRQNACKIW